MVQVYNMQNRVYLAREVLEANTFFLRLKGLLFTKELLPEQGLIIKPCKMIHTIGMNYPIDVLFLSQNHRVIYQMAYLLPNRVSSYIKDAHFVIELPSGTIQKTSTRVGDYIVMIMA